MSLRYVLAAEVVPGLLDGVDGSAEAGVAIVAVVVIVGRGPISRRMGAESGAARAVIAAAASVHPPPMRAPITAATIADKYTCFVGGDDAGPPDACGLTNALPFPTHHNDAADERPRRVT
jgi:hypothetical protein